VGAPIKTFYSVI